MHFSSLVISAALLSLTFALPLQQQPRATACFVVGSTALASDIVIPTGVTCDASKPIAGTIPGLTSGSVTFSSIDFRNSKSDVLGFSLATFTSAANLQDDLNVYLAAEAAVRSLGSSAPSALPLNQLKVPKFFLQFQQARVSGVQADITHQRDKVIKNASGASSAEIAQVSALATTPI